MPVPADKVRELLASAGFHQSYAYEDREVWFRLGLPLPVQVNFPTRNAKVREKHFQQILSLLERHGLLPPEEAP